MDKSNRTNTAIEYLNIILSNCSLPIITIPSRVTTSSSTIIDHIILMTLSTILHPLWYKKTWLTILLLEVLYKIYPPKSKKDQNDLLLPRLIRILYTSPKNTFQKLHFPEKHLAETALSRTCISLNVHFPEITFPWTYTCQKLHFPECAFARNYIFLNVHFPEIILSWTCTCQNVH